MIHQGGGTMLDPSGRKAAFGGEPGLKAMQHLRRFVTEGGMPLIDFDSSRAQFTAGQMGIHFDTPARLRVISDQIGNKFTLGTEIFPIDNKAEGRHSDRRQRDHHHGQGSGQAEGGVGIREVPDRPGSAEGRRRGDRVPADEQACDRPALSRSVLQGEPTFRDRRPCRPTARVPWQGYPGGNSVRVWRTQREIIIGVMRGEIAPEAGLDRLVKETNALLK